jgi:opacity protein-like surface antigen
MRVQLSARERRRKQRRRARKPSSLIRALTAAALALPGLSAPAAADSAPTETRSDYRYSRYAEDNLKSEKVAAGGERSRYDIDIHQFRFETGVGDNVGLGIDLTHEAMSGATPWYVTPDPDDPDGEPIQVMTGATIDEKRTDALLSGSYYLDRGKASLGGGISSENDYLAFNANVGGERNFNEKNTTLSGAIGGSWDRITPSDTREFPDRVSEENKQSYNGFLALGHVLGRATLVQTSVKYQFNTGFLNDPYKRSLVAGIPETDERPDQRHQFSSLTRFRHHLRGLEGTLHFDYMFYFDDWDMSSHTFELAWYQTLFDRLRLVPSLRYYSQSQADFYAPFFAAPRSDGLRSSDYRLSPFGAYSYKIEAEVPFDTWGYNWELSAAFERYVSGADLALESVDVENPGLVSFNLFTVGLTARF